MQFVRGKDAKKKSELRTNTFTGRVWADPILGAPGINVANVNFEPGARTYWHSHPAGQLISVDRGLGYVAARNGESVEVKAGDVVFAPADEEHWHGAGLESFMVHTSVSLGEATNWLEEVSDADYERVAKPAE